MKNDPIDKDQEAMFKIFQRRSKVFLEEAIMNMLESTGPDETIQMLTFWINEIIDMAPDIAVDEK
jgi:hypothetical protein